MNLTKFLSTFYHRLLVLTFAMFTYEVYGLVTFIFVPKLSHNRCKDQHNATFMLEKMNEKINADYRDLFHGLKRNTESQVLQNLQLRHFILVHLMSSIEGHNIGETVASNS